jgi:hypothetical protein
VRCANQFLAGKSTDLDKCIVAVGDHAFGIGSGNQPLLSREGPFALSDRLVITHGFSIRKALNGCRPRWLFIEIIFP